MNLLFVSLLVLARVLGAVECPTGPTVASTIDAIVREEGGEYGAAA